MRAHGDWIAGLMVALMATTTESADLHVMVDFDREADARLFLPVDDAVMGGVSSSSLLPAAPGVAAFAGTVSLDNNGGFASVRSVARDWQAAGARAFVLRVRGDGKAYRFNLRTPGGPGAFRYEASFEAPAGAWTQVELPLARFIGKAFGKRVPLVGPPDPARIETLGFMISDRQAGPFRLEIDWIAWK